MEYKGGADTACIPIFPRPKVAAKRAAKNGKRTFEQQTLLRVTLVFSLLLPSFIWFVPALNPRERGNMKKTQTMFLLINYKKRKPEHKLKEKGRLKAVEVKELN